MKGRNIPYSAEELAWLEDNRLMVISDYHRAFCERFGRTDVSFVNLHSLRKRKGWMTGRTGFFEKGAAPHNKGKPCPEGKGGRHPNARRTQFRKGVRQGVAVKLYKPIGTERITEDGYLERKINDDFPAHKRWRCVHLLNWEAANGPVPAGHALKCLDGDRQNTDPSNWEAVPRALLPRLAGKVGRYKRCLAYDDAAPEIRPALLTIAKLSHAARQRRSA